MSCSCGCCAGVEPRTPVDTSNRPWLDALAYRIGTHDRFLASMIARLSGSDLPSLAGLTTRDPADPAIALLDGAALLLDVLCFYQERIAAEGYLRTATERRSIRELARLVGYRIRPGVSASTYLAYLLEEGHQVVVPRGSKVQSVPGPGELPQTFETAEDLDARSEWNQLTPRLTRPQWILPATSPGRIYFKGLATGLKPGDPLLFVFGDGPEQQELKFVQSVVLEPDATRRVGDRTRVNLELPEKPPDQVLPKWQELIGALTVLSPSQLRGPQFLGRRLGAGFEGSDELASGAGIPRLLGALHSSARALIPAAMQRATVAERSGLQVYALRTKAGLFGHNAPQEILAARAGRVTQRDEWPIAEDPLTVDLDGIYESATREGEWLVLDASGVKNPDEAGLQKVRIVSVERARPVSVARYGISGRVTRFTLAKPWITLPDGVIHGAGPAAATSPDPRRLLYRVIRQMAVYTQTEPLELAEEPITDPVCGGGPDDPIELAGLLPDLPVGRWITLAGERDIPGTAGVSTSELAMIASVRHDVYQVNDGSREIPLPGDRLHTFITLARPLAWCYRRDSLKMCANVVRATHGETRYETLGSGDASQGGQTFILKGSPLTFTPAPSATGADSTLDLRVNEVRWHELESLARAGAGDRAFMTDEPDDRSTRVRFGDGVEGSRLPTGVENLTAIYRNGIGRSGNMAAGALTLLASKPLGVKEVSNPVPASGGADADSRDRARRLVPNAVRALDRLVSIADYQDFTRNFAGIGKACARYLSDGTRQLVYVTIAGVDDIPILESSDLFRNLRSALTSLGDPALPVELGLRELIVLVASAGIGIHPDFRWESVEPRIRALLLDRFGFESRELGQPMAASELLAAIQSVPGVEFVDLDAFGGLAEWTVDPGTRTARRTLPEDIAARLEEITGALQGQGLRPPPASVLLPVRAAPARFDVERAALAPAQLAVFVPAVPQSLVLTLRAP